MFKRVSIIVISTILLITATKAEDVAMNIEFVAQSMPKIVKPPCVKLELIQTERVILKEATRETEPLKFTYRVTFHQNCQGMVTLISVYQSRLNRHTNTVKKSYKVSDGKMVEVK